MDDVAIYDYYCHFEQLSSNFKERFVCATIKRMLIIVRQCVYPYLANRKPQSD